MNKEEFERLAKETKEAIENFKTKKEEFIKLLREKNEKLPEEQKDNLFNLALQIVTAGKADADKYIDKIDNTLKDVEEKEKYGEVKGELVNSMKKIKERFKQLNDFMLDYSKEIEEGNIDAKKLKEIELKHIKNSLEGVRYVFRGIRDVKLKVEEQSTKTKKGISKYNGVQTEWEENLQLLGGEKDGKVSTKIIPTLNELFGRLENNKRQSTKENKYNLKTPFKTVQVEVNQGSFGAEILIYYNGKAYTYKDMCNTLDALFEFYDKEDVIENIIKPIIKYLKHGTVETEKIKKIVDSANSGNERGKNTKNKKARKGGGGVKQVKNNNLGNTGTEGEAGKENSNCTIQDLLDMFECKDKANLKFMRPSAEEKIPPIELAIRSLLNEVLEEKDRADLSLMSPSEKKETVDTIELAIRSLLVNEVPAAAASLSGILMLAESCKYRNPTFGKLERNAMKSVLKLAEDGCEKPFSKVFSNKKGWYVPAHSDGGNMQTQELLYYEPKEDSIKNRLVTQRLNGLLEQGSNEGKKDKKESNIIQLLKALLLLADDKTKAKWGGNFYNKRFFGFLDSFISGKDVREDTIEKVFKKLEELFPGKFCTYNDFKGKNSTTDKRAEIDAIKKYKSDDENIRAKIEEFGKYIDDTIKQEKINYIEDKIKNLNESNKTNFLPKLLEIKDASSTTLKEPFKIFQLLDRPNEYTSLKELPRISSKYLNKDIIGNNNNDNNNSNANEEEEVDIGEIMESRMNKNFRRLYKSQNQVFKKEVVKKLLEQKE